MGRVFTSAEDEQVSNETQAQTLRRRARRSGAEWAKCKVAADGKAACQAALPTVLAGGSEKSHVDAFTAGATEYLATV
jgi:hypothetical protein